MNRSPPPAAAEPVTVVPIRTVRAVSMRHRWRDVTFIHWPVDSAAVRPLLPERVAPDLLEGTTFLGLIGLRLHVALVGIAPVPWLGTFDETHLRVYSVDRSGHRGTVFLTLNADRLITSAFARTVLAVPYSWSPTTFDRRNGVVTYSTERRWPRGPAGLKFSVRIGRPRPDPSALEHFVTARWSMHTKWCGQSWRLDVDHPAWPLFEADVLDLQVDDAFFREIGLAPIGEPVSALWSPGVRTKIGFPEPV